MIGKIRTRASILYLERAILSHPIPIFYIRKRSITSPINAQQIFRPIFDREVILQVDATDANNFP